MVSIIRRIARKLYRGFSNRQPPINPDKVSEWRETLQSVTIGDSCRLSQAHVVVRNPYGCQLSIGSNSDIDAGLYFENCNTCIHIGSRTSVGGGTLIDAACGVTIGNDVMVAFGGLIMDHDSHSVSFSRRKDDVVKWIQNEKDWSHVNMAPVVIEDKAWLGARVIILKGVTIGEGAVVGAGSVVTRSVAPWTIVAGNPARVIRELTPEER